jgi:DNA-directed RNA polymerase specialized sigma24 family protein
MLNGRLTLHNIHDVEAFTAALLPPPPDEDLHQHLIICTWQYSTTYRNGTASFSTYIRPLLQLRIIDYTRKHHGDHRYKTGRNKPQLISLNALAEEQDT